jgi:hypothetical protein
VACLEEPKDTRFEKLSGVVDFGGANGEDLGAPEPCAERGVFRPDSGRGGVGRKAG